MKTIEEAAKKYAEEKSSFEVFMETHKRDFIAGVEFAQQWYDTSTELPICFESGSWDGLRSEFFIVKFKNGDWGKARLYSGVIDGCVFNDWYSPEDYLLCNITHFRPIELK